MPSLVIGPFKFNSNDGVINFGDSQNISPKDTSKTIDGSGGSNTGDFIQTNNGININNTFDHDVKDQNQSGNV
ncbi:spore germination protein [Alteribacillus bidgolensis]|uniref:Spore germination protein PF n=1 Tax=Alteribacillus bidgolensis TaxID=930129 RepID=A0A1G8CVJ4_9BACI|nr:spore germination protein [Alteribacillus bidgolensis]SDH49485.1 spore germination protein PF [Alteribacillus bidgolensis]